MDEADDSACKIIRNEARPNFLPDKKRLGSMESGKANGIFKRTEGRFNPPAAIVKLFETVGREILKGKIGNQGLKRVHISIRFFCIVRFGSVGVIGSTGELYTNDAKRKFKEVRRTVFEEVKRSIFPDIADIAIR